MIRQGRRPVYLLAWMLIFSSCVLGPTRPISTPQAAQSTDQDLLEASSTPPQVPPPWKPLTLLKTDLQMIQQAGYKRVCLFDLQAIRDYPDPAYISFLRQYADKGIEITVYVQDVPADQETINLFRAIGATRAIIYERELLEIFQTTQISVSWWAGVAFPYNHTERPQYMSWPDLRSEQMREELADWAVQIPASVDGGLSLDYIRWNQVGDGRTAEQVTDLVQKIRDRWDQAGHGRLSAAVYPYLGNSPRHGGALSVGQKWNEWLDNGLVDWVYPMAYNSQDLAAHIREWKSYDPTKIVPCLSLMDYSE